MKPTIGSAMLGAVVLGLLPQPGHTATNPTALTQYATIVGSGPALHLSRLPVTNANGVVNYWDVNITLSVGANGTLGTSAAVTSTRSPALTTANFQPGRYFTICGNGPHFGTLSYGVGSGGSTVWTLIMDTTPACAYPQEAVWQTGSTAPDILARLKAAKTPINPDYSYGSSLLGDVYGVFAGNGLLAAFQVGNTLSLISYSSGSTDEPSQVGGALFTLCVDQACSNS